MGFGEKILHKVFGDPNQKYLESLLPVVDKINELEPEFEDLSNEELKEKTKEFKRRLKKESLDDLLPEVFAQVREASKRTLNQRHFDVQLVGGIAMHEGKIVEMKTGEGKTLAATPPVILNALKEKGVHIVTVNDYLARRDTVWMGQIYHLLGFSVGCLNQQQSFIYDPTYKKPDSEEDEIRDELGSFKVVEDYLKPCSRKEAYQADITYGTNNQFGFDYLRDNMVYDLDDKVQREHHFAILDEIDSILIDEARTPLIVSSPDTEATEMYKEFSGIIPKLDKKHYEVDEEKRTVTLTEEGIEKVESILGMDNIYEERGIKYLHHLEQALRAQAKNPSDGKPLFAKDRDYVVKDGEVIIVDEFTGRLMPGRRWSGGLHQALEAKEGLKVKPESKTLASITFQNYFRMYDKLAGMTGTAATSSEEFHKVYGLDVVVIPTNEPLIRESLPDKVYKTREAKFRAVVEEVKERHEKEQPVLVGTVSIDKNEYLSKLLKKEGIPHQVLNAKNHEREGEIIAQAGKLGAVTVATNMAGRGVDIVLGGNPPDEEEAQKARELGGLHVIGTERHESRRIDNQLRGRAGRQGDPGSSQFFVSLEDDLVRIFGGDRIQKLMDRLKLPEDQPIEANVVSNAIENAQSKVEGRNFDIRKHVLEYDDVLVQQRKRIYKEREKFLTEDLEEEINNILREELRSIVEFHYSPELNLEGIKEEIEKMFSLSEKDLKELRNLAGEGKEEMANYLIEKGEEILADKERELGSKKMRRVEKLTALKTLDFFWMNHLSAMDSLKDSVRLRAYGQQDPLVEYKTEGHRMFKQLLQRIKENILQTLFKVETAKRPEFLKKMAASH